MNIGTPAATTPADDHVFLIGRPPISEYLGFVVTQTVNGASADTGALTSTWREAHGRIMELERREAGYANEVGVAAITNALQPLAARVVASPVVQRAFAVVPVEIVNVELDRLVVFQKHINLEYVRTLENLLGSSPTEEDVFRFCLPIDKRFDPPVQGARTAQNAWTFHSTSTDFRVLEGQLLRPDLLAELPVGGIPVGAITVPIGYGSNLLTALGIEGRLILHNASHRAYTLRKLGYTHAPCLVQQLTMREELELVAQPEVMQNIDAYLSAPRPPVLKDYFDEQLRMIVGVPRKMRQVRVVVNYEQVDVPAA